MRKTHKNYASSETSATPPHTHTKEDCDNISEGFLQESLLVGCLSPPDCPKMTITILILVLLNFSIIKGWTQGALNGWRHLVSVYYQQHVVSYLYVYIREHMKMYYSLYMTRGKNHSLRVNKVTTLFKQWFIVMQICLTESVKSIQQCQNVLTYIFQCHRSFGSNPR